MIKLAGALLLAGFATLFAFTAGPHPHGDENDHPVIFGKYADSDAWIATHIGQFAGVILVLGGFVALHAAMRNRGEAGILATLGAASAVMTGAVFAVLQALDGVALKHAVDAWQAAEGPEKAARFADAESLRWFEWGLQSYFRFALGLTFVLFGAAIIRTGIVPRALGAIAAVAGTAYAAIGVAVGYDGFEQPGGAVVQLLFVAFIAGVLVSGLREGRPGERVRAARA